VPPANLVVLTRADTIYEGVLYDTLGVYQGQMNRQGMPHGHGIYVYQNGRTYEGHFENGARDGFGCIFGGHERLLAGEWQANTYKGERMIYSTERIYGIDISKYQHEIGRRIYDIDWSNMRITSLGNISSKRVEGEVDYSISFVYIKSTEGTTIYNKYYSADYQKAKAAGLRVGTYHFFSTSSSPIEQARSFLEHSHLRSGDLPPVLDVEPSDAKIKEIGGADVLFERIRSWMTMVESAVGVRPVLYVGQMFVNKYLVNAPDIMRDYDVWIARYSQYKPDVRLAMWQLCPDGRVNGVTGDVDLNVFNGYEPDYEEFLETKTIP